MNPTIAELNNLLHNSHGSVEQLGSLVRLLRAVTAPQINRRYDASRRPINIMLNDAKIEPMQIPESFKQTKIENANAEIDANN